MQIVRELIERYLPGHSDEFIIETIPPENGHDTYELDTKRRKNHSAREQCRIRFRGCWLVPKIYDERKHFMVRKANSHN